MALKSYNPSNVPSHSKKTAPMVTLNRKAGTITFNAEAQRTLSLDDKSMVEFYQDENEPSDWFVAKVKKNGFGFRRSNDKNYLIFNSSYLVKTIFDSCLYDGNNGRLIVGEVSDDNETYALVTAGLRNQ
jgi:hypothetical protein